MHYLTIDQSIIKDTIKMLQKLFYILLLFFPLSLFAQEVSFGILFEPLSASTTQSTSTILVSATTSLATTTQTLRPTEIQSLDYLPYGKIIQNVLTPVDPLVSGQKPFDEQRKFTGYEYDTP
jgi:hypothetical protein